ncbi:MULTISPECIES: HEPN domain-containing protein [Nocardia]|uniref:HEPN domain-containing protein n=1 Tax=Nocardia TaxID=1817 RepID=UPI0024555357|nr:MULTISPECIES: HEPN domain-containing protein [Nocardia]
MSELETTARKFVAAAFAALRAQNAIPTSDLHRHLQAHVDFNWTAIQKLPAYAELVAAVVDAAPTGLPSATDDPGPEFTVSLLLASFLEYCVERCARAKDYDPGRAEVAAAVERLREVVNDQPYDLVVARHISHLVAEPDSEIEINGITILTDDEAGLVRRIRREIPDAEHAWKRIRPRSPYRPPYSLLIARTTVSGVDYHHDYDLRKALDRFELTVALLTCANAQAAFQVSGASSRISARPARLDERLMRDDEVSTVRRTARLTGTEGPMLESLSRLVDSAFDKTSGDKFWSSFRQAFRNFTELDHTTRYTEQLVQLATALEGVMIGPKEGEGLTLRLCSRVAALLASDDDPAQTLFEDLKQLYNLRSVIVHGGEMTMSDFRRTLNAISTVPASSGQDDDLDRIGYAVDRLRDIVRRAILARICLATGDPAPWPLRDFKRAVKVDVALSDDGVRAAWRAHWRDTLESMGIGVAARRAAPPVHWLSKDDT